MTLSRFDRDDVVNALKSTFGYFDKDLTNDKVHVWIEALIDYTPEEIKKALRHHYRAGKFAPKIPEIEAYIQEARTLSRATQQTSDYVDKHKETKCPPEITRAWIWFIKKTSGYLFGPDEDPTPEQQDIYLNVVNHEAKSANNPEAIPDEYKLREVWGDLSGVN